VRADDSSSEPSRARIFIATIVVALIVLAAWAVIEYRSQPPPPPNPIGATPANP
jgi:hypothetical protein